MNSGELFSIKTILAWKNYLFMANSRIGVLKQRSQIFGIIYRSIDSLYNGRKLAVSNLETES